MSVDYETEFTTNLDREITVTRASEDVFLRVRNLTSGTTISSLLSLEDAEILGSMLEDARSWSPREDNDQTIRQAILSEAAEIVSRDRNVEYGEPEDNFQNTADLINAQFKAKFKEGQEFTAGEVAVLMILLKLARVRTSPGKRDHWVDIAGYAACGGEVEENK